MTGRELFIEEKLLNSVKKMLSGRVNELLEETECFMPPIEFDERRGGSAAAGACSPALALSACERSEKERIVRLDAYTLTISFAVPEHPYGERDCYAYAASAAAALQEDPTLGGVADRAALTGKQYKRPKAPHCGEGWEVVLSLRVTIEEGGNAG
jgi:hypothetical protein